MSLANDFSPHSILLVGECERGKSSLSNLGQGCHCDIKAFVANEELDIAEAKGVFVVVSVLPWAKEEQEGKDDHIRHCLR